MSIPRTTLFLVFVLLLVLPLLTIKIWWLAGSKATAGILYYKTRGDALDQFRESHSICYFIKENDTIWFNATGSLRFKEGDAIRVRYQTSNPSDARVMSLRGYWGGTLIYGGLVFLVILVAYLNRGVFPRGLKIDLFNRKLLVHIT